MTERVTYEEAAKILDCHISNVPKLVRRGELTSSGTRRGALSRVEVDALAHRRSAKKQREHSSQLRGPRGSITGRTRTTSGSLPRQVAELVGITKPAVLKRIHRGKLPAVQGGGRFWVRYDHLELVERARLAQRVRHP